MFSNLTYDAIAAEFGARVPDWTKLEGYVTDAIIRDAYHKLSEFWSFWDNDPRSTQNGRMTTLQAFVTNYVETVESLDLYTPDEWPQEARTGQKWTIWGTTLRVLEVS
jgi:hypothetical protein